MTEKDKFEIFKFDFVIYLFPCYLSFEIYKSYDS